jgi:hypothetical protein
LDELGDKGGDDENDLQDDENRVMDADAVDKERKAAEDEQKILLALIFYPNAIRNY